MYGSLRSHIVAEILLVEPDQVLARTYAAALKVAGHHVRTSLTAQGALQAADANAPDLVLLELQLVAHSGVEFLHEFRSYADWQRIPVIINSSVPPQEFRQSVDMLKNRLGVQAYLYKPATTLSTLLDAVEATFAAVA